MMISRLKLENWRNFRLVDVEFQDRNFFVGANASGKSNLLDALRFLHDLALTEGGGLQSAVATRRGLKHIRNLTARNVSDITIEVELKEAEGVTWRYRLSFGSASAKNDLRAHLRAESVDRIEPDNVVPVLARPNAQDLTDPERLTETALEQTSANHDFRSISNFFRSIDYLNVVPQIVREPGRVLDPGTDYFGGGLIPKISATAKKTREARLKRMNEALKTAVPQLDHLEIVTDDRGVPHLRAKYVHWRPQGAWQQEDQFSDGTLRLLGLIWALLERGGPLLLEEPELSLHSAVIAQIPTLMWRATKGRAKRDTRQTFVTTHSVDLLSDPSIGADEVFLLQPTDSGTEVQRVAGIASVESLLESGQTMGDAVLPLTRPDRVEQLGQLSLF